MAQPTGRHLVEVMAAHCEIDSGKRNTAYYRFLNPGAGPQLVYRSDSAEVPGQNTNAFKTAEPTIGIASRLWADPYRRGVILSNGADGQLYYATDAGSAAGKQAGGQDASWTCIDPTPNDRTDIVTSVDFPGEPGVYYVTTVVPAQSGSNLGGIYKVVAKNQNPPVTGCQSPLSEAEVTVTTIISPDQHWDAARISIDPEHPDTGLYATFQSAGTRVAHLLLDQSTSSPTREAR